MVASTPVAIITRTINNAKVHLPGTTTDGIQYEFYNVLDEFLSQSEVWTEDIPFEAQQGVVDYDIVPVSGRVVNLVYCWLADGPPEIGGLPASMPIPGWLQLAMAPSQSKDCLVKISLTVLDPVTKAGFPVCPTWVLERYHGALTSGLIYKMALQPAKPWSNSEIAVMHGQKFRNEIGQAKVDYQHAHTRGAQRWRYPQQFMPMLRR
jgi:hypothetical protein